MRNFYRLTILIAVLALFGAGAALAGKQAICHFPPGNEANFHTIVVSDNAVDKHVEKHGDFVGTCLEYCEFSCDDGIFCTQDVQANPDECICVPEPRPESNCDDSNPCTVDTCNADVEACTYDTEIQNGTACDDGNAGTTDDVCTDGVCAGTACEPNQCQNGGTCIDVEDGGFVCRCPPGYHGPLCEDGPCDPNPCQHGGQCSASGSGFTCDCVNGWTGDVCEIRPA